MKKKALKLPNWIIKNIKYGKEDEELSSIVVNTVIFYLLGIVCFFVVSPFGKNYRSIEIICAIGIGILLAMLCFWIISQVALLDSLRKEAIISYRNAKTDKEIHSAHLKLKKLCVPISMIKGD